MNKAGGHIVIDPVLDRFNQEKIYTAHKDYYMNTLGIPIQFLNGVAGKESAVDLVDVIIGNDLKGLEGLGTTEEQYDKLFKYLVKTRNLIAGNPAVIEKVQSPKQALQMFNYAIKYWHTDKRDEAIERLAKMEEDLIAKGNILLGADSEEDDADRSISAELGQATKKGGFFRRLGDGIKKTGQHIGAGLKTVVSGIVKYNPLSIAARNGFLLAMRINLLKMSDTLQYGYLTEAEARKRNLDLDEWKKIRTALDNTEKLFVNTLKGQADHLKSAILSGKREEMKGLGVEPVTTAAGTAAASGFLSKVGQWLKGINLKKLLARSPEKSAFIEDYKSGHGGSQKGWRSEWKGQQPAAKPTNMPVIPATPDTDTPDLNAKILSKTPDPAEKEGFLKKAGTWIKNNKTVSFIGGLLLAAGITLAVSPKAREKVGLSARKEEKEKNNESNPSGAEEKQPLSGTKHKLTSIKLT